MKTIIRIVIALICFSSCSQDKRPLMGDTEFQRELNAEFKDASKSPLKTKDRKNFKGLDFFKFDPTYVVKARLERTPDSEWFNMRTTTSRVTKERIYGILHFELKGKPYQLNVNKGVDTMMQEWKDVYMYLPFIVEIYVFESYVTDR